MNFTTETIITEEIMKTEEMKNAVAEMDEVLTSLADLIGELLAIKQNMAGKTFGEVEEEINSWSDKLEKIYWQF